MQALILSVLKNFLVSLVTNKLLIAKLEKEVSSSENKIDDNVVAIVKASIDKNPDAVINSASNLVKSIKAEL